MTEPDTAEPTPHQQALDAVEDALGTRLDRVDIEAVVDHYTLALRQRGWRTVPLRPSPIIQGIVDLFTDNENEAAALWPGLVYYAPSPRDEAIKLS